MIYRRLQIYLAITLLFSGIATPLKAQDAAEFQHANTERNLRWLLERVRRGESPNARVGVYAEAGVWHEGAKSLVDLMESSKIPCRLLDRSLLTRESLQPLTSVIIPGGWAPLERESASEAGLNEMKTYVERGGRCVGVCAGAYLLSRDVRYEGVTYPYPLGLFDGVAEGPVSGLASYPTPGVAEITATDEGDRRGLTLFRHSRVYYSGGPFFVGGTKITILARYADGSAAVIRRPVGQGEIVLTGAHPEIAIAGSTDQQEQRKLAVEFYQALCQVKPDR